MEAAHNLAEASSGKTIEKKTFLLATIGSKGSTLLTDLLAPTNVGDVAVTYERIKTTLQDHLKSKHLEIVERLNSANPQQISAALKNCQNTAISANLLIQCYAIDSS